MKLKIVNEQEKNIVYLVTDTTEKFNLPRLTENQILLAGSWPARLIQYDKEKLKHILKENGFHYSIYIGRINLNDVLIKEDIKKIEDDQTYECVETLLDWLNEHSIVKVRFLYL